MRTTRLGSDQSWCRRSQITLEPSVTSASRAPWLCTLSYASVLLPDGRVLVAGGAAVPEVFDPVADAFTSIDGSFGRAPYFATATLVGDGSVLLAGGYSDRGPASDGAWLIRP